MAGGSQKQQTVDTSPWAPSQGYRKDILSQASALQGMGQAPTREQFTTTSYAPARRTLGYPSSFQGFGQRLTPSTTFDQSGYDAALARYQSKPPDPVMGAIDELRSLQAQPDPLEENAYGHLSDVLGGKFLSGNPYIDNIIAQTQQGVNAQFSGAGRYGSGVHQGYLADASNRLRYQDYDAERGRMMQGLGLAPTISGLRYAPAERGVQIEQLAEDTPWNRLARYTDLVNAASAGGSQQTSPIYRNRAAGMFGGAASGAALASMLGATGWGLPLAAVAGGLFGGMG